MRDPPRVLIELRQREIRHDADGAEEGEGDRETDAYLALGGEVPAQEGCVGTRPPAVWPLSRRGSRTFFHRRRLFLVMPRRKGPSHAAWNASFSRLRARVACSAAPRNLASRRVDRCRASARARW